MFKRVIKNLIQNRKITLFLVFIVIAAGTLSYIAMPKQESPDFSVPYAMITTIYPGASQTDVDTYVTLPITETVMTLEGYETSFSYSYDNLSLVILELKFSTDESEQFRKLKEELNQLQAELPDNCGQITVNTNVTDTAGVLISLSSDDLSNAQVTAYAKAIQNELKEIDGFSRFEIMGTLEYEITVEVDQTVMQAAGLTLSDITALIEAASLDLPVGSISEEGAMLTVDYTGGFASVDDVQSLPIGYVAALGRTITVSDIAQVTYSQTAENTYYTHNGKQAVILAGYFAEDINVLPLKADIQDVLDQMEDTLPENLDVSLIISQPQEISDSLSNFLKNLLIAVVLVILVVLFGMGFKNAVVVSVSLPLSVLMSFIAMHLLGIKIHQISVAALVLSLGMLVDNSIVVSDAIQNELDEGTKQLKACVRGVQSVALPILTSTVTTIAAYAPFIFLNSIAGDYIKALPQIVCIALAASYLSAVLIIPVLGYIFFRARKDSKQKRGGFGFQKILQFSMRHRVIVIVIVLALLAGSGYLAMNLNIIFFPASDGNIIYIDIRNNTANDVSATQDIIAQLETLIAGESAVTEYSSAAGGGLPRFNSIMYVYTKTPDIGQIMMRVDFAETAFETNEDYKLYLQQKIDEMGIDAKITVKELMYAFPMDEDIKIQLLGDDLSILKTTEDAVYDLLIATDGLTNENRSNSEYASMLSLMIDADAAAQNGIIPAEALNELSIAMLGREAASIRNGDEQTAVLVSGAIQSREDLLGIGLHSSDGRYIDAGAIINLIETQELTSIPRIETSYAFVLTADYDLSFDKAETFQTIKDKISTLVPDDVKVVYDGEDATIRENFGQIGVLGIAALAIVFIVLLLQFKSFKVPLVIFITIPLSVIGSVTGLYITGLPLSFTALLGVVSLLGIVVNNAIILLDSIQKTMADGSELKAACINASMRRLRPIMLSSVTTVIGLIPLAISNSELFKPMAVALMSGLMISALLTLVVLPVFVSLTQR